MKPTTATFDALESRRGDRKELSAPHVPVLAKTGLVPGDAEIRRCDAVLRRARGNVGMMVLHLDDRQAARVGPAPRGVAGMKIGDDGLGR